MAYPNNLDNIPLGNDAQTLSTLAGIGHNELHSAETNAINAIELYTGTNPVQGGDTSSITYQVQANTTAIATNTSNIATNTSNISTNTTNITSLQAIARSDGWSIPTITLTYSSYNTSSHIIAFTTNVDPTAIMEIGDAFKFTITGANAGTYSGFIAAMTSGTMSIILDSSVSALATGTVSSPFYARLLPHGFTQWLNFSPTWTGFSVNPTVAACRFTLTGRICTFIFAPTAGGTSNATTLTMSLPFTSKNISSYNTYSVGRGFDNGAECLSVNFVTTNTNTLTSFKNVNGGAWTGSGTKFWEGTVIYEIDG